MYYMFKKMNTYPAYISKHNSNQEHQINLLMTPNRDGYHYLAVKRLFPLLREITSKHEDDFYCLNYFHQFRKNNKLK